MLLAVGVLTAAIAGCGSGGAQSSASTGVPAQVASVACSTGAVGTSTGTNARTPMSCVLVLTDGRRFRCRGEIIGPPPTPAALTHRKGCSEISSLALAPTIKALAVAIYRAQTCITKRGFHATGAPVLPQTQSGPASSRADGELLVLQPGGPVTIGYYTSSAKAQRLAAMVRSAARRTNAQVQRHGAETIVWSRQPSERLRHAVQQCL